MTFMCKTVLYRYFSFQDTSIELIAMKIPVGESYLRCNYSNKNTASTFITNFYHVGPISHNTTVLIDLLVKIAAQPIFNTLRTKEQLCYYLSFRAHDVFDTKNYLIQINSMENKFRVDYIDARIEKFRQELVSIIEEMSDEKFEQIKRSLMKSKLTADLEIEDEVSRNWEEIRKNRYIFDRSKKEVEILETINKADLLEFYLKLLNEENRKLSVQIIGNADACNIDEENENYDETCENIESLSFVDFTTPKPDTYLITDVTAYKETLELYPSTNIHVEN